MVNVSGEGKSHCYRDELIHFCRNGLLNKFLIIRDREINTSRKLNFYN